MSQDEALLALEPEFKRMKVLHKMERFNKAMSNNLSILFETMSTIGIVGKSERVHPICDVLLQRGQVSIFVWKFSKKNCGTSQQ